jgi:hypothetical protein
MKVTTQEGNTGTQYIALAIVVLAALLAMFAFAMGRNDPTTRTIVLTTITGLVSGLLGLGAGLLTGGNSHRETSTPGPAQLTQTSTTTVQPPSSIGEQP